MYWEKAISATGFIPVELLIDGNRALLGDQTSLEKKKQ